MLARPATATALTVAPPTTAWRRAARSPSSTRALTLSSPDCSCPTVLRCAPAIILMTPTLPGSVPGAGNEAEKDSWPCVIISRASNICMRFFSSRTIWTDLQAIIQAVHISNKLVCLLAHDRCQKIALPGEAVSVCTHALCTIAGV